MGEIVSEVTVNGTTYVRVAGKDPHWWWKKGVRYTDNNSIDTEEIGDIRDSMHEAIKELEGAEKRVAEYKKELQTLERLRGAESYGNSAWFKPLPNR